MLILFISCATPFSPTPEERAVEKQTLQKKPPSQVKIYLTAKEGADPKQIKDFIEHLECRVIENIPPGGKLYLVEVPPSQHPQEILAKLNSHPWIIGAALENDRQPPPLSNQE